MSICKTDGISKLFAQAEGESRAASKISAAKAAADAYAARILAERECPEDLKEWGRAHGIPVFAEVTWQAGFLAGMRVAIMDRMKEDEDERHTTRD